MTLHILTISPQKIAALQDCLGIADSARDALVLVADGVYCLNSPLLAGAEIQVFYLEEDARSMGIICTGSGRPISYLEFVSLTEAHQSIKTWH